MERMFNQKMSDEQIKIYHDKLREFPSAIAAEAFDLLLTTRTRFPTVHECVAMFDSVAFNKRREESERLARQERKQTQAFFAGEMSNSAFAKACSNLIAKAFAKSITRQQFIDECAKIGVPTKGYWRNRDAPRQQRVEDYYAQHALDLDAPIGKGIRRRLGENRDEEVGEVVES